MADRDAPDPYEILGVSRDATGEEIDAAFKRNVKRDHPDVPGGSKEKFVELKRAQLVHRDPELRERFDRTGHYAKGVEPDNQHVPAMQELARILGLALQSGNDLSHEPLIDAMRMQLRAEVDAITADLVKLRKLKDDALKVGKRFKHRGRKRGPNWLRELTKGIADQADQAIAKAERIAKPKIDAIALLDDYDFEMDQLMPLGMVSWGLYGSGASS
jgi:curved DNA-binding protein CbpA